MSIAAAQRLHPALHYICLAASLEYELKGEVSANVMEQMLKVMNEPSSTKSAHPELSAADEGSSRGSSGLSPQIDCTGAWALP